MEVFGMAAIALAQAAQEAQQGGPIDGATAISVSLLLFLLGAAWKLSGQLSRIDEKLTAAQKQLEALLKLPEQFGRLEQRVDSLKSEVDALWKELKELRGAT